MTDRPRRSTSPVPTRWVLACLMPALLLGLLARPGRAEEIIYRDPQTCAEVRIRAQQITAETWTEIRYRVKERGPEESVPTSQIVSIERDTTQQDEKKVLDAIGELGRGALSEARRQLRNLSGGGWMQDLETGQMKYTSFMANDPPGRRKRPPWKSEYAHFFYAKALYLEGLKNEDKELLTHAYLALVDQKVPGGEDDQTTGGFLKRFAGENSRWYGEALLLTARTLVALERYDDAAKRYQELYDAAIKLDIGARWAYQAKLGAGVIAEAKGESRRAYEAYEGASSFMKLLCEKEQRPCARREIGRLYSRARTEAARILLQQAEKNKSPSEFLKLRNFIKESRPEALAKKFKSEAKAVRDALVAGALEPEVQAVMRNGEGLAFLHDKRYEEAILAFRRVEVMYFQVRQEHARALHYLAEAAGAAAGAARGEGARKLFESYRDDALRRLREEHADSRWAK